MTRPPKRLPGQSNDDYEGPTDPNAQFLGTHSLSGGGGGDWSLSRVVRSFLAQRRKKSGPPPR